MRALAAAEKLARDDPVTARKAVGNAISIDDALMAKPFNTEDYANSLDQAMLLAFDDQTRWAMRRGIIARGPIPNHMEKSIDELLIHRNNLAVLVTPRTVELAEAKDIAEAASQYARSLIDASLDPLSRLAQRGRSPMSTRRRN